jgi:hypothetical protein
MAKPAQAFVLEASPMIFSKLFLRHYCVCGTVDRRTTGRMLAIGPCRSSFAAFCACELAAAAAVGDVGVEPTGREYGTMI